MQMHLKPNNVDELSRMLADANSRGEKVSGVDLASLNRLLDHKVEDMTCRVEAGMTLAALQRALAARGQWLPIDPPGAETLSIDGLLAANRSGSRRFGYGTIRDYVIGLTAVLADGRVIHSGGNVVKNVAGYDLMKLFVGSRGSLGVIVEAIFKLRPIPETESFVEVECASLEAANKMIESVLESELTPVVLDLHNVQAPPARGVNHKPGFALVLGFAGTREELEWQFAKAAELGIKTPSSLGYANAVNDPAYSFQRISVLPSRMIEMLGSLGPAAFIAHAGNGIIYHGAAPKPGAIRNSQAAVHKLEQRLKAEFDPKHILPAVPA
jgi:glycolate oxidase FAD binding subunit